MGGEFDNILVTGASGQIGSELVPKLRSVYGKYSVIASDLRTPLTEDSSFELLDVTNEERLGEVIKEYNVDAIVHLAALLSASGEQRPNLAWHVNINGLYNILEAARIHKIKRIFHPSSIAVFGPETPRDATPQETVLRPKTIYGITKVTGELLGNYYFHKFGLDVRGLRYPGIISNKTLPTGGTTDYAVEIFYEAIKNGKYQCFLREDSTLPMMYIPDCLKATIDLMNADLKKLKHHADFNLAAMSFSPKEISDEIKQHLPKFIITYKPDYRQAIADSWPKSIDDLASREEWGWKPSYDLKAMVKDMLEVLGEKHKQKKI